MINELIKRFMNFETPSITSDFLMGFLKQNAE